MIDRWTIELGDIDAGGGDPIWPQSDAAREPLFRVVVATFILISLALLVSLALPINEDEIQMPKFPTKTAETPENELPFPGKLVEGRYDVQYLHL